MDSTRWRHLKALFEAALDRPPEERTSFLDEACAGDEELRQELESLLMAAAGSGPFDALADEFVSPLLADLEDDADLLMPTLEGRRVGPYEIARRIGQGGMGAVYLAERADGQFEQQVALKLVRHGLHGTEGARRFLAERQILARLQHPHIARLLDGGITEDGQPYFAMEYVDGLPLDAYCDEHELGIETRLRLFQTVCDAVHYAHQNLIVHRDLKPSNILVTEDPGSGPGQAPQVKLLDFGIAKLIDVEDEGDLLTRTGMPVLTPAYASPEQVRCQPITTASDVYTLGVVLFELLTGQRPYDVQGRSPSEVEEMVCETEPPAPSAIVTRPAPGSASDAPPTRTSGSPEVLRRRLAGDLDTIILKAMQKEPGRRYASAEALRDDLQRHLDGLPVTARPSTLGYRARTFVRRHRTGVTAAALVALAVLAGIVGTVWQARVAAQERDAARQEAAKAERVASFMIDVFETLDPSEARGDTITAREILDRGARRVRTELAAEPAVQAQMMDVIGRVYQNLGLYDRAGALLDEALTLRRTTPDVAPGDLAASLHHKAVLLHARGAYDAADSLYQRALQMRRDRAAPSDVAETLDHWGQLYHDQGAYNLADSLYGQALALRREAFGAGDHRMASTLSNLAVLRHDQGRYDVADSLYRTALALNRARYGTAHPVVASDLNNLATLLYAQGATAEAESTFREVLTIRRQLFDDDHPDVATALNNLAALVSDRGDIAGAEALYREALSIRRRAFGPNHPRVATSLNNLAWALYEQGDLDAAEPLYREALAVRRRTLGDDHPSVAISLNNVARLLQARGQYADAEPLYREALALRRRTLGDDHPYTALSLYNLAGLLDERGTPRAAEPLYREALAIREATLPGDHLAIAVNRLHLGQCLMTLEQYAEAETLLVGSLPMLTEHLGEDDALVAEARSYLADLYAATGRPAHAASYTVSEQLP